MRCSTWLQPGLSPAATTKSAWPKASAFFFQPHESHSQTGTYFRFVEIRKSSIRHGDFLASFDSEHLWLGATVIALLGGPGKAFFPIPSAGGRFLAVKLAPTPVTGFYQEQRPDA